MNQTAKVCTISAAALALSAGCASQRYSVVDDFSVRAGTRDYGVFVRPPIGVQKVRDNLTKKEFYEAYIGLPCGIYYKNSKNTEMKSNNTIEQNMKQNTVNSNKDIE